MHLQKKHLKKVKLLTTKYVAFEKKNKYQLLKQEFKKLKEIGIEEIKQMLEPEEQLQLQPLFRKFENTSAEDEQAILDDQDFIKTYLSI